MVHNIILLSLCLPFSLVRADNDTVIHGWVREPDGRGTWSIVWSSIATISLCTWSALHMSVPEYHDRWKLVLRKLKYFSIALVAPESILIMSLQDYVKARSTLVDLQHYGGPRWTMVHAQFLMSHGFDMTTPDGFGPIDPEEQFRDLVRWKIVTEPPISSDELQSRSKSDWFVKFIAILQILYFASQTFFRALQQIRVTPLEVLVVGFIFCSLLSYAFNWSKPQDVEYPVVVQQRMDIWKARRIEEEKLKSLNNSMSESTQPQIDTSRMDAPGETPSQQDISQSTGSQQSGRSSLLHDSPPQSRAHEPVPEPKPCNPETEQLDCQSQSQHRPPQPCAPQPLHTARPLSATSAAERQAVTPFRLPGPYTLPPMPEPGPYTHIEREEKTSRLFEWLMGKGHMFVGFYSVCMLLSTIFGAIHCAGWNSPFPSHAEMVMWRVCSVMTTALATPCIWTIRFWLEFKDNRRARNVKKVRNVMFFLGGNYIAARMLLIALAFTTLRSLPAETYETVEWTRYLPNFSS